jgi:hypothetical protein
MYKFCLKKEIFTGFMPTASAFDFSSPANVFLPLQPLFIQITCYAKLF